MSTANRRRRIRSPPATDEFSSREPVATASSPYIPPELIPEVARRLTSLQDFFALRASCRAYRAALPLTPSNLASQAPLLLVPQTGGTSRALFHLPLRCLLRFRLPFEEIHFTRFHSLRCFVGIQGSNGIRRGLRIVNLLTGERAPVPCPPGHFDRFLLSGDLALAWNDNSPIIQYCRIEAADWHMASISEAYLISDLICVNGTVYALVTPGYRLAVVGLSENPMGLAFLRGELDADMGMGGIKCFAECRGDLILILINALLSQCEYRVYRWQAEEGKWERINGLDGCTLFLVNNRFAACLGPGHPGVRGDCIYSTFAGYWSEFSLVDGSYAAFALDYQGVKKTTHLHAPVWVLPSMC